MEQTTLLQMHPNPDPNAITSSAPPSFSSSYTYCPPLPHEPAVVTQLYTYTNPTITDAATPSYPLPHGYYLDPNLQDWAANAAVQQYGSDPAAYSAVVGGTIPSNGTDQLPIAQISSSVWTNLISQPQGNIHWKKRPKKTKVVQSAYCEICKVDCNSKDVLDQHKLGKKHKKNLEKSQAAAGQTASAGSTNPVIIGPQENPNKGNEGSGPKSKKKAPEPIQDLETKRRKIVEGGAAVEAVRTCAICNVVCNSETVFSNHLSGQKHNAMVKKHGAGLRMTTAT